MVHILHCHLLRVKVTVAESPIALLNEGMHIFLCDLKRSSQTIKHTSYRFLHSTGDSFIKICRSKGCLLSSLVSTTLLYGLCA